jgi:hypothetical protein
MPKKLIIDGGEIEVEDGITLIQACEQAGGRVLPCRIPVRWSNPEVTLG